MVCINSELDSNSTMNTYIHPMLNRKHPLLFSLINSNIKQHYCDESKKAVLLTLWFTSQLIEFIIHMTRFLYLFNSLVPWDLGFKYIRLRLYSKGHLLISCCCCCIVHTIKHKVQRKHVVKSRLSYCSLNN